MPICSGHLGELRMIHARDRVYHRGHVLSCIDNHYPSFFPWRQAYWTFHPRIKDKIHHNRIMCKWMKVPSGLLSTFTNQTVTIERHRPGSCLQPVLYFTDLSFTLGIKLDRSHKCCPQKGIRCPPSHISICPRYCIFTEDFAFSLLPQMSTVFFCVYGGIFVCIFSTQRPIRQGYK